MKNKIFLIISSAFLITSIVSCNNNTPSTREDHVKKSLIFMDLDNPGLEIQSNFDFFNNDSYVVYIPIENYQDYIPSFTMSVKRDGSQFTFTNLANKSKAYLYADSGVLTYDAFSKFTSANDIPHEEINFGTVSQKVEEESYYKGGEKYSINLNDYNLKPINDGGTYYLPADVLMRIDPLTEKGTLYYDGKDNVTLIYNSNRVYYQGNHVEQYPESFYQFCYDLFTFDIDLYYGLNGFNRHLRYNDSDFVYNKEGARKTFEPYREGIVKVNSIKDFDIKFDEMIAKELDDGGHTTVDAISFATKKEDVPEVLYRSKHLERKNTSNRLESEQNARETASTEQKLKYYVSSFNTDEDTHDDIGYVFLDGFNSMGSGTTREILKTANERFNRKNKSDYQEEAKYIKDVVIDLAYNGGGSTACEGLLLSWICGGKGRQILKDARDHSVTKSVFKYNVNYDVDANNNPIFDEQDYLPDDVNIYILTDATFSAACALTFDTYMYTLTDEYKISGKNIKFIGKPNLGGSCSITNTCLMPTGFGYHFSSNAVGIYWNDESKTCDEILPISEGWNMDVNNIVNRTGYINPRIKQARSK